MTHAEIAAMIRQHAPGALPESFIIQDGIDHLSVPNAAIGVALLPDDIAEAVLRDAMVMDALLSRDELLDNTGIWYRDLEGVEQFKDSDYGGSLGACCAAWKHARGIE